MVEKKPVIENKIVNSLIAILYAVIVLSLFLQVSEELALRYFNAYERFMNGTGEISSADFVIVSIHATIFDQVVLMLIFSYGLFLTIRDSLTPKKIGIILIAFFSVILFQACRTLFINWGNIAEEYKILAEENSISYSVRMVLEVYVLHIVLGIIGVLASYFCFIREENRKSWFNIITIISVVQIINKCIEVFKRMNSEKFYVENNSLATLYEAELNARVIIEGAVLSIAIYALIAYQAHVLYRKRKLAMVLSNAQTQSAVA